MGVTSFLKIYGVKFGFDQGAFGFFGHQPIKGRLWLAVCEAKPTAANVARVGIAEVFQVLQAFAVTSAEVVHCVMVCIVFVAVVNPYGDGFRWHGLTFFFT